MATQVPIGKPESEVLEFKAAAVLRNPFSISRVVVAMLNARGGDIWIGIREEEGMAVAAEDIPNVRRAREDVLNHLIEVVEPRLQVPGDIEVESVAHEGRNLIRVHVSAEESRGPFAQIKDGGRHFLRRVDHRLRPMDREEIFGKSASEGNRSQPRRLKGLGDRFFKGQRSGLWVGFEPNPELVVDVQDSRTGAILLSPSESGNRGSGWSFRCPASLGVVPRLAASRIELGDDEYRKTTVWEDGTVEFWTTMSGLRHRTDSIQEIYPLALLEYPVSVARLASTLYSRVAAEPPREVFMDAVLVGAEGWRLPAYAPGTHGHLLDHETPQALEDGAFRLPSPLGIPWREFHETPDYAGYMLVRSVYQAFHLPEDRIPREYAREERRLVLGD